VGGHIIADTGLPDEVAPGAQQWMSPHYPTKR
jgi:hypothetical protein